MLRKLVVLCVVTVSASACPAQAPPKTEKTQAAGPRSTTQPAKQAYADFDRLLRKYVDANGMVDYAAWKKGDEPALEKVTARLAAVDPQGFTKGQKLAYWINVYNAVMIQAMLELHPVGSVLEVTRDGKKYDVFKTYPFGPSKLTLDHIEHQILRKLGDPRIHAAIVCASKGCPPLRAEAFEPGRLDAQLDDNVRTWFQSKTRGLEIKGDTAYVSEIFNWFGKDFGKTQQDHLNWIARYVDAETAKKLRSGKLSVKSLRWDWAANQQ